MFSFSVFYSFDRINSGMDVKVVFDLTKNLFTRNELFEVVDGE